MPREINSRIADHLVSTAISSLDSPRGGTILCTRRALHSALLAAVRQAHEIGLLAGQEERYAYLVLLRSHFYSGPFNLDYKPPRTTSNFGVFAVSFPTAVDRFITLWEMAGESSSGSHHSRSHGSPQSWWPAGSIISLAHLPGRE